MPLTIAIVGCGRLGTALAGALRETGHTVAGPLGRGADAAGADIALLCVPDAAIGEAAAVIAPGPLLGHCSGATGLDALAPRGGFALHPLMTVTTHGARFTGAGCAIAGSTPAALEQARALAADLRMQPFEIAGEDRALYHAAASVASNFLVTLEGAAERLAAAVGVPRSALVPLVHAAVDNWGEQGAQAALTGPIARGDEATVARQRDAVAEHAEDLLPVFDALADATRALAGRTPAGAAS